MSPRAQMDLDQDELDDASEDLEQAGGDPQSKIKRLQAEHEAGEHGGDTALGSAVNPHEQDYQTHTLLSVFRAWQALREKKAQLQAALEESKAKQQRLSQRHETLSGAGREGQRESRGCQATGQGIRQEQHTRPAAKNPRPRQRRRSIP